MRTNGFNRYLPQSSLRLEISIILMLCVKCYWFTILSTGQVLWPKNFCVLLNWCTVLFVFTFLWLVRTHYE